MPVKTLMRLLFVLGDGSRRKRGVGGGVPSVFPAFFRREAEGPLLPRQDGGDDREEAGTGSS